MDDHARFWHMTTLSLYYIVLEQHLGISSNKSTSLWNFATNSRLG